MTHHPWTVLIGISFTVTADISDPQAKLKGGEIDHQANYLNEPPIPTLLTITADVIGTPHPPTLQKK